MGENETLMKFIYLFKAPSDDSNLVNIFEMSDLFYRSTPYLPEKKANEEEERKGGDDPQITEEQLKQEAEAKAKAKAEADEDNRQKAMNHYLNDPLSLNEELFYTKLQTIMSNCINENKVYDVFLLLRDNHLIKASS